MDLAVIKQIVIKYGIKVFLALITFFIGLFLIKSICKLVDASLKKRNFDSTLRPFLSNLISVLLKVALVLSILGMVGIQTTSFIAILGAAGLAVGMALQGTLGNFAGGVLLLIFRPFKVGDTIQAQGFTGTVSAIGIFCTELKSPDNKVIFIPNGPLAGGSMINLSKEDKRRVDLTIGISYDDDLLKAKNLLMSLMENDSRILQDPAPFARVGELADSSVNFTIRAWVNAGDFWGVYFDLLENIKLTFDKEGLTFPFPQQEIHLNQK